MVQFEIGKHEIIQGHEFIVTRYNEPGWALFGPFETYEPARYTVAFSIQIGQCENDLTILDETVCCIVDVAANAGNQILVSQRVLASTIRAGMPIVLEFTLDRLSVLEFRVFVTGAAPLLVAGERVVSVDLTTKRRFAPILKSDDDECDAFFAANFSMFLDLHSKGAEITCTSDGTIVKFQGISLNIRAIGDIQVIYEILVNNDYNFNTASDVCVIDIGMNVGLASLFFARNRAVRKIYSFEPFEVPFRRALENFALNAELSAKINPRNFGLGATTEELSVLYDESNTLAGSVRGRISGKSTAISIRNATEVFGEVIGEAHARGWDVVCKMDCEGSEFSIFETLDADGILPKVRIFMIEWHKWWSAEKTQHDLIGRLMRNGFDVFDRTNPFDPFAGSLYAIRSAR